MPARLAPPVRLLAASLLAASWAVADEPDPPHSTWPPAITLVGNTLGVPDSNGRWTITVRDFAFNPLPNAHVQIHFGDCVQAFPAATQRHPGVTLEQCQPAIVGAVTDALGRATFIVEGSVLHRNAAQSGTPCARIIAESVPLGSVRVAAFDQDGVNGVRASDLGLFLCDLNNPSAPQRSDFNGTGTVTVADLPLWAKAYFDEGSEATSARCDGAPPSTSLQMADGGDLYLAWGNCRGNGGAPTLFHPCDSSGSEANLIASLRAPADVDALTGFEAVLEVIGSAGQPLPEWWRLDAGGCRSGAYSVTTGGATGGCSPALWPGGFSVAMKDYSAPDPGANTARVRIVGAVAGTGQALVPGTEYPLFKLSIFDFGTPDCPGCSEPVALVLRSVRLTQPAEEGGGCLDPALALATTGSTSRTGDYLIHVPGSSSTNVAYFNGVPEGFQITDVPLPSSRGTWLAPIAPNPAREPVSVRFHLTRSQQVRLALYDVAGRRVRVIASGNLPAGEHQRAWDLLDVSGAPVANGLYFCRLTTEEGSFSRRVVAAR